MMSEPSEFEVTDLKLKYPMSSENVLEQINVSIGPASFNILLGQNGSGKSSLIKCLAGIQTWTSGDVTRRGVSRLDDFKGFNHQLILVSEDVTLPNLKIETLAAIYKEVWGQFDEALFQKILSFAGIKASRRPLQLSRGQKALLQLALALAAGIKTLLIDEVTAVLDPYVRNRVVGELIAANRSKRATIVVATNIASEFEGVDCEVILLEAGRVYLSGRFSDLQSKFAKVILPANTLSVSEKLVALSAIQLDHHTYIGRREDAAEATEDRTPVTLVDMFVFLSGRARK